MVIPFSIHFWDLEVLTWLVFTGHRCGDLLCRSCGFRTPINGLIWLPPIGIMWNITVQQNWHCRNKSVNLLNLLCCSSALVVRELSKVVRISYNPPPPPEYHAVSGKSASPMFERHLFNYGCRCHRCLCHPQYNWIWSFRVRTNEISLICTFFNFLNNAK